MACCGNCNTPEQVKVKRIGDHDLPLPAYKTAGAACFDLQIQRVIKRNHPLNSEDYFLTCGTGFAFEVPEGHVMLVYIRSSLGCKKNVTLANNVGVIDSDYRGEILVNLRVPMATLGKDVPTVGDRVAQAMIVPVSQFGLVEVSELSDTERGEGGFGSTGKQ